MDEVVKNLSREILHRFPEVKPRFFDPDRDSPHELFDYLVKWIRSVAEPAIPPDIQDRIVGFDRWCMSQPPGKTAADDVLSIAVVSFREQLFAHDELLPLVPKLMSREELLTNAKYLTSWVGPDRYEAALRVARPEWKRQRRE